MAGIPFDLLHSQIVKYAKEMEEKRAEAKNRWKEIAESIVDSTEIDKYDQLVKQAFMHSNAETQLESMGYRVGFVLAERLSKDAAKFNTELEIVKFICKEFWSNVFGKQVDNLRTNHAGVYVVQDNNFSMLRTFSDSTQFTKDIGIYLAFPSGVIRGALACLNVQVDFISNFQTNL
ncbi:hypothetical protein WR25_12864 isoform B [Diploscapter pachys]|uniref:Trafficking protein particle complex subunit 6B n=1 Tax=Diploscapter pachys TaxID=2018661 RepID=A0A2A2LS39_9BILA|nr:hypothetical protein WR25_12864 isoform B [Diploscapter pachys]